MTQRPDLIVPIRDRRQRRRILTWRRVAVTLGVAAVLFAGVTLSSERRRNGVADDYGRLFGKQVSQPEDIAKPKYDVVTEAPVTDQTASDPTLVSSNAREQYLLDESMQSQQVTDSQAPTTAPVIASSVQGTGAVTIVGDGSGVSIVRNEQRKPVLKGGIFRPQ